MTDKPDFDKITPRDLLDNDRLAEHYIEAVRRKIWPNSPRDVLEFWCMAEKALAEDKHGTPGKLFYANIKAKNTKFISDTLERRAIARMDSSDRQKLVDRAGGLNGLPSPMTEEVENALFGRDIGYHHGIMMQCFLPQKCLPKQQTEYETSHGRSTLIVRSGRLAHPDEENRMVRCTVPFGAKARIIMPFIIGYAVIRNTPVIDLGRSLRRFMESINVPIGGRNGKAVTEQVNNIAAADFMLGEWNEEKVSTKYRRVASEISFWLERRPDQLTFWNPEMILSPEFFEAIQTRRVPVDMEHLVKLATSPRRMDLYCWLSYRLPTVREGKGVPILLKFLQPIFAPDMDPAKSTNHRSFKKRFKEDLQALYEVYDGFNVELQGDMLWLYKSPSPVPHKVARLL